MNIENLKSKIHFNLPSLLGLISQIVLLCLWFSPSIDFCKGLFLQSLTPIQLLDRYNLDAAGYVNAVFLFLAVVPWTGRVFTTSLRGELIIPLVISYAQLAIIAGFRFVYIPAENMKDILSFNGYGIAMTIVAVISIILCHVAYLSIRKYRKSLKTAELAA